MLRWQCHQLLLNPNLHNGTDNVAATRRLIYVTEKRTFNLEREAKMLSMDTLVWPLGWQLCSTILACEAYFHRPVEPKSLISKK